MKKTLAYVLLIVVMMLILASCGNSQEHDTATPDEAGTTEAVFVFHTKYFDLDLPAAWEKDLDITIDDSSEYTISFAWKDGKVRLFDLLTESDKGSLLGTLHKDGEDIRVSAIFYDVDSKASKYNEMIAVQDDINLIISNLKEKYDFDTESKTAATTNSEELFEINTDHGVLYYPKKWEDKVTIELDKDTVKFKYKNTPLFDLIYGGEKGTLLGTQNGTNIYVVSYEVDKSSVDKTEMDTVYSMMDDINVIAENLNK